MQIHISKEVQGAIEAFKIPDSNVGFGNVISPMMAVADYEDGKWSDVNIIPYGPLTIMPTCKVLHYGQEIFEGIKGYYVDRKGPFLFRPIENARRFNLSAKRMAMPELPVEVFVEASKKITDLSKNFIPNKSGDSLYIRPFMIATEESLGIRPSNSFKFIIVASPSSSYFSGSSIKVLIEREMRRAFPGGTGTAKTGGNYAAGLRGALNAKAHGCEQTLWLDAVTGGGVEELSGMNLFFVINDELYTPALTNTILEGVTRKSLVELATKLKINVHQEVIKIDWLIDKIKSNTCTEAFACGTAAVITPIELFREYDGSDYKLKDNFGPITKKLRRELLDIQEGRKPGPDGWSVPV